jgi:hypothetical protein
MKAPYKVWHYVLSLKKEDPLGLASIHPPEVNKNRNQVLIKGRLITTWGILYILYTNIALQYCTICPPPLFLIYVDRKSFIYGCRITVLISNSDFLKL